MKLSSRGYAVAEAIRDRVPFQTYGALSGDRPDGSVVSLGILPEPFRQELLAVENTVDYVVYSYSTPIAWHGPDGWTVPSVKYSVTTSKHQGKLYLI